MNINFNISLSLVERLVAAIEKLTDAYTRVHAASLHTPTDDGTRGRVWYQNDKDVYDAEREAHRKHVLEYGEDE